MTRDQLEMGKVLEKKIDNLVESLKVITNLLDKKDIPEFIDHFMIYKEVWNELTHIQKEAVVIFVRNCINENIIYSEQSLKDIKTTEE
jgi:hypothetical protein